MQIHICIMIVPINSGKLMSKWLWHFDIHSHEIWDNTYLDILSKEDKELLEFLYSNPVFIASVTSWDTQVPKCLNLVEISDEEADVIKKYVTCKSFIENIYINLYYLWEDTFGEFHDEILTIEQVKQLFDKIYDSNS